MELTPIITVAAIAASAFYSKKTIDNQKKQVKAAEAAAQKEYDLNVAQTKLALEEQQRKNKNLLEKQQSAYKARLGASGMSSKNGTGQTVLDTMQQEHDIEDKYLVNQANISLEALLNGINESNTRNLLSLSTLDNKSNQNMWNSLNSFTSTAGRSMIK